MCWSYIIDPRKKIVTTFASGKLNARDVASFRDHISMDPNFDPGLCLLLDFNRVKKVEISPEEVWILATMKLFSAGIRRAFVMADHHPSVGRFGMLELFNATRRFYGEQNTKLFTTQEAALRWLCPKARTRSGWNITARKGQGSRLKATRIAVKAARP